MSEAGGDIIVFDLDGTLINVESCVHLMADQDYEGYADATLECPPYQPMVKFARLCQKVSKVIIVTAKPERLRARTLNWLSVHGIIPDVLLMRPKHNFQSSPELKFGLLEAHYGPDWKRHLLFAVEDRDKMVDAWRAAGIQCMQCAPSLY